MKNIKEISIKKLSELDEKHKSSAIELFLDGFGHMFLFTKDREVLKDIFLKFFDYSLIYVALSESSIVGFIAISDNKKRPVCVEVDILKNLFGKFNGRVIYNQMRKVLEKIVVKGDNEIYIEFLVTAENQRGKGVASKLINHVCSMEQYDECYIEVFSKNIGAKKLYEHLGFVKHRKKYDIFMLLKGYGSTVVLKRKI